MASDTPAVVTLVTTQGPTAFSAAKDGSNNLSLQSTPRVAGAPVDIGNPMPVADAGVQTMAGGAGTGIAPPAGGSGLLGFSSGILLSLQQGRGSTGADFSANPIAIPLAGNVLLATIPANPARASADVQNQSITNAVQLVRDDGLGGNTTSIMLNPAAVSGQGGGYWSSTTFKGRVRVYGPTGTVVAVSQD